MKKNFLLIATLALAGAPLASADIIATLDDATQTGTSGGTLVFNVTLTNSSTTDQVWLNGFSSTASSPFLTIDTSSGNANAPYFLDPQTSSGWFDFFHVTIDPSTPAGAYTGSFVSIQGGADGGTNTRFDDLVDVSFDVDVPSAASGTPEPGTLAMLGLAVFAAFWWAGPRVMCPGFIEPGLRDRAPGHGRALRFLPTVPLQPPSGPILATLKESWLKNGVPYITPRSGSRDR